METLVDKSWVKAIERIEPFIGNTPLFPLTRVFNKPGVQLFAKLEWQQMGASVKSRPAFNIIKQAVLRGDLRPGKALLDATSGNTGIGYATIGAALGIPVTLCLPENASAERKMILKALGVEIIYTSPFEGTDGSQIKAKEMVEADPDKYYYADQYGNEDNWKAHLHTTAKEIWEQTEGKITHFVAGMGTTGTMMGTGRGLKKFNEDIHLVALQPEMVMHGLEGWKHLETAIVPKIYDDCVADEVRLANSEKALEVIQETAAKEGLLISPSAAANLSVAMEVANELDEGVVVTVFADSADKYGEVYKELYP